jgi:hypothetical protein
MGVVSKSCGRFARALAMITQRPTIGSLRKSGMEAILRWIIVDD